MTTESVVQRNRCRDCGAEFTGRYCNECGTPAEAPQHTLVAFVRDGFTDLFSLESGFIPTARDLLLRPGKMVAEWLERRPRRYVGPVRYLLPMLALSAILSSVFGLVELQTQTFSEEVGADPVQQEAVRMLGELFSNFLNIMLAIAVPLLAVFSWLFFRGARRSFVSHLVFNTYAYAQQSLLFVLLVPVMLATGGFTSALSYFYTVVMVLYYAWACVRFFETTPVSGTLRAVLVTVVAYLTYYGLLGIGIGLWMARQ